jgi:hypothetical protein
LLSDRRPDFVSLMAAEAEVSITPTYPHVQLVRKASAVTGLYRIEEKISFGRKREEITNGAKKK